MLRVPQLMLILSVSLPLALVFSAHVSASGFIDAGSFQAIFTGSTAVLWGGLALYTRDTDRRRQLPDVFMTYVNCGNTSDIHSGAATCLVYAAGNILIFAYVLTGAAFALCEMLRRRQGDFICFTQEYQARVREFARAQQKAGEAENAGSASRQEGDE